MDVEYEQGDGEWKMIFIPKDEFRRLLNDIQAYLDNPSLPDMMAKIAIGTLRMYDTEEYEKNEVD